MATRVPVLLYFNKGSLMGTSQQFFDFENCLYQTIKDQSIHKWEDIYCLLYDREWFYKPAKKWTNPLF